MHVGLKNSVAYLDGEKHVEFSGLNFWQACLQSYHWEVITSKQQGS